MQIMRTYKMRLHPTAAQEAQLGQVCASVRTIYNAANEQRRMYGRTQGTDPHGRDSFFNANRQRPEVSTKNVLRHDPDLAWLAKWTPMTSIEAALADLDQAWDAYFANIRKSLACEKPGFRSALQDNSFRLPMNKTGAAFKTAKKYSVLFNGRGVRLPKIGWISWTKHRRINGEPRTATITREGHRWYICIACRIEVKDRNPLPGAIGIDVGVTIPVALSTGEAAKVTKPSSKAEERIEGAQRAVSRSERRSKRRRARVAKLAALQRSKAARVRAQLHKASRMLANQYGTIAVEDLKLRNMTRSAKGTAEKPGKNVKQKSGLNRAILKVPKYAFRTMLEYKAAAMGGEVIAVNPAYTSQTCSCCGHVDKSSRESQAVFVCTACGHAENADFNAAKNILFKSGAVADPRKTPSESGCGSATSKGHAAPQCAAHSRFSPVEAGENITSSMACGPSVGVTR